MTYLDRRRFLSEDGERDDVDINMQDLEGNNAFMNLCKYKNSPSWRVAFDFINHKELNLNLLNNKHRTALMELLVPYTYSSMDTGFFVGVTHNDGNSDLKEAQSIFNVAGKKWYFPRKKLVEEILKKPNLNLSVKDINGYDVFDLARKFCPEILPMLEEYKENN